MPTTTQPDPTAPRADAAQPGAVDPTCHHCPEPSTGTCASCDAHCCDEHLTYSSFSDEYHCAGGCEPIQPRTRAEVQS